MLSLTILSFGALFAHPALPQNPVHDPAATPPSSSPAPVGELHAPAGQAAGNGARVTIVESTSANSGHDMDAEWQAVCAVEGFASTIVPQSTLQSTAFFATTDILIVSSGVIGLNATAVGNIQLFLAQGGGVYLQGEYLPSYDTNIAFATLCNNLGGSFGVGVTHSGDLQPMQVSGVLSNTPYATGPLTYHWYGCDGVGSFGVVPFMHFSGADFGWFFDVSNGGRIVHNTDQDWVRTTTNTALCANILYWLCDTGFRLTATNLVAGQTATLETTQGTPSGSVLMAYSLTGGGPTNTPYGPAALSQPIVQLPMQTADTQGMASYSQRIPLSASGLPIWLQAVDLSSGTLSNGIADVIL